MKRIIYIPIFFTFFILGTRCKKLVSISPPTNTITTTQVYATDDQATSAMAGAYAKLIYTPNPSFGSGAISIYCATSADELEFFSHSINANIQFQDNTLLSNNQYISSLLWSPAYSIIYITNSVIAGVESSNSPNLHDSVKNELIGEAEFIRAFCNFYLKNLFDSIPLVNTTNWEKTNLLGQSSSADVYRSIIADLQDAQKRLPSDYSIGNGQRIIPNKWVATALLARVYLYTKDYADAITQSTQIINNTLYSLSPLSGPTNVFSPNSTEAIWQLQQSNTAAPYNATPEGNQIIPISHTTFPYVYITPKLINSFDSGDLRRPNWVDSTIYQTVTYYYPHKYKTGPKDKIVNGTYNEYYMVLRLAEQYLIRSECEANGSGGGLSAAIQDLNMIRNRAGLPNYAGNNDQQEVLSAIFHERQIEFFCEWGSRWLDLIRSGQAHDTLSAISYKHPWSDSSLVYPIPYTEVTVDPNLHQNPGY